MYPSHHVYHRGSDTYVVDCARIWLLTNPPYGERLGRGENLGAFYKLLGDVLKQRFKGWNAFVLSGNKELAMSIGLRSAVRTPVYNGTIPCQLMKYEMY